MTSPTGRYRRFHPRRGTSPCAPAGRPLTGPGAPGPGRPPLAGLLLVLALCMIAPATVRGDIPRLLPELNRLDEGGYLLLVLAEDQNDDRLFEVHLTLSNRWNALTRRRILPLDALPRRHDVAALARITGVQGSDFALVLLNHRGEVLFRSTDPARVLEILPAVDADRREQ